MNKAMTAMAALAALLASAASAGAAPPPLFGTAEFRAESLDALPKWQRVLRQIEQEQADVPGLRRVEREPAPRARRWRGNRWSRARSVALRLNSSRRLTDS